MKASVVIEFLTKGLDKAKAGERSLRDLGRAADGAGREASDLARAENRIADAGNRMAAGQTRAANSLRQQTEAMRRQKAEAAALSVQQDRLIRKSQLQAKASAAGATAGLSAMHGVGAAFIGGLGLGVGGAAGVGLVAKETMELSARIEYERDQLQVLGEYSDEKARLYDKILKPAGARRGVGTIGAYGVFGELMAGGLNAENASSMTDSVLTFAKATRAETADAGKTAVALQNNMKIGAGEMMDAFDAMALAGKEGQFEVRDMARNAPSIFAKMAKLGEGGLQGVRGFAAMAQEIRATAGTSDEAATNFENMLDKMTSGDFIKNAKKMGINVEKVFADANKRGVSPVLEMLKKIKDVTRGDTFKMKELMPDVQANSALSALVNKIPEIEAAIGRYGNAGGTVMRDFATATDNANEAWNRFSANIQNQAEQIGSKALPVVTNSMNRLSKAMEDIDARRAAVAGETQEMVDSSRDEFGARYKKINPNAGPMDGAYLYEQALAKKGRGEIPSIMTYLDQMEERLRGRKVYEEGKAKASVGRHTQPFLGITFGRTPIPSRREDNLPAEPGTARWFQERYGKGTGREQVSGAIKRVENANYDRDGGLSLRPKQGDIVLARIIDNAELKGAEERTRDAYSEYGRSRMEGNGQAPSWWKEFLLGKAAWPNFDARDQFAVETRPFHRENAELLSIMNPMKPAPRKEKRAQTVTSARETAGDGSGILGALEKSEPVDKPARRATPATGRGTSGNGVGILGDLARSAPALGQNAGDGFAKGVEEGGKKGERAMESSARAVEQIAGSVNTYAAGQKAGNQFAAGLEASAGAVAAAANKALVQPVANRVPQSPAKIGPLRKLPVMGRKIAQQLAGGIEGEDSPARAADAMARDVADGALARADRYDQPVRENRKQVARAAQGLAVKIASDTSDRGGQGSSADKPAIAARQVPSVTIGQINLHGVKDAADGVNSIGIELERRLAGALADVG
nr:phage tail tape measure protein [uncultured Shinella sp.]